jgi:prephenate dehydratase
MKLAALGGPHTFNGKAAMAMLQDYPMFDQVSYFPTSEAVVEAALAGAADAACAPEQMSLSGFHSGMLSRMASPGSKLYVIAEKARFYSCSLLGKPGATLEKIRSVSGHNGSIAHSRSWLESHLPGAAIHVVDTNSEVAARTVLESDGSSASVGDPGLAADYGLVELAQKIDGGSAVNYWAISPRALFSDHPNRLLLTGRFANDARLSSLIQSLVRIGFHIRTACPQPSGQAIYEYDYMLRFVGGAALETVKGALSGFEAVRLAGAWNVKD